MYVEYTLLAARLSHAQREQVCNRAKEFWQ